MANWYGAARSNYFHVKDEAAFRAWAKACGMTVHPQEYVRDATGRLTDAPLPGSRVGLFCEGDGGWPSSRDIDDGADYVDIDLIAEIAAHLPEGEVVVLMQAGAEKLRYIDGYAIAFDHTGESVNIALDDIYALATTRFGIEPTRATY